MVTRDKKLVIGTPDDVETIYYEAFRRCDINVMAALWAPGDVVCVHPGSGAVVGYDAVIRSWRHILDGSTMSGLRTALVQRMASDGLAVHLVAEQLPTSPGSEVTVLATNVYRKFAEGWLMVEHHASVVEARQDGGTLQ